ncbi:hypothetical protein B0H14DRAFT_3509890 [Mycena olivaceomarginata]|nr:hypothetical protein B0H14DRAFT_3509890 [Mycena olivaceomarginata]
MHRARRPAATSTSRRINGQSSQRLFNGRIVKTSTQLNQQEIRAVKNLEFDRETQQLASLTNAQRHAEEAHLDLLDDNSFYDPLADVLEGNVRADISHAGEDFAPEQARASNRELWQALPGFMVDVQNIMDATVSAYLDYSLRSKGKNLEVLDGHPDEMAINHYPLVVVDLFSAYQADIPMFDRDDFVVSGLVNLGLFPCSLYNPTVAITIRALEVFPGDTPSLPTARDSAICSRFMRPSWGTFLNRVEAALGHDTPNWRLKNACPACLYMLEGEDELLLPVLTTQDGNNSLSRHGQMERPEEEGSDEGDASVMRSRAREDNCKVPGDYYLSRDEEWNEEDDGCSERWSNMREEITSRALVVLDMVQSGELAKYGFAVVNHLLNVIGQVAVGYDIGCKFGKMVNTHPVLGPLAAGEALQVAEGVGLEDLEECESFFSKSNALAPCTRYASGFHRHQAIVSYLKHMDIFDTYQSLSLLLVTKYKCTLEVRRTWTALKETMVKLGVQDVSVFEDWLKLEKACLDELSTEPLEETLKMEYYQKLRVYQLCVAYEDPSQQDYQQNTSATRRLETQRRHAMELRNKILLAVQDLEIRMDLRNRWTPGCAEWSEAAVLVANRRYQRALDKLQGLVIARLFELTKCHMSGTGYKMRKHIAKALQARSRAIKTAIEQYNAAAAALEIPREPLSWEEVVDYTFLSDFDLLRTSHRDILTEGWAQPAGRECSGAVPDRCRNPPVRLSPSWSLYFPYLVFPTPVSCPAPRALLAPDLA